SEGHPALVLAACVTRVSVYRDEASDTRDTLMTWEIGRSSAGPEAADVVIFELPQGWTDETRTGQIPELSLDVVRLTEMKPGVHGGEVPAARGEAGGPPAVKFTLADLDRLRPGEVVVGHERTVSRKSFLKDATTC